MKLCPTCGLQAPIGAPSCVQCGHQYRTSFAAGGVPPQTQAIPPAAHQPPPPQGFVYSGPVPIPPAPKAPTFWEQVKNPHALERYQAELMAYRVATGQITDAHREQAAKFMRFVYVVMGAFILWTVGQGVCDGIKSSQEMDRSFQQMREDQERLRRSTPPPPSYP